MTDRETTLLQSLIQWCRASAENVAPKRPDEALGLLRAAAKFEEVLKEQNRGK